MTDLVQRIQELQRYEAKTKAELARNQGRKEQLMAQLKKDFGCESLDEAREKLKAMQADVKRREDRLEKALSKIEADLAQYDQQ